MMANTINYCHNNNSSNNNNDSNKSTKIVIIFKITATMIIITVNISLIFSN